ncbi:TPA: TraM recognition domain-containing protein, partial [Enterococcus faecium]|nr:TraM recognition domain-containing protein [Enterococcus faecium]
PLVSIRGWDDALQVGQTMAAPLLQDGNGGNDKHFIGRATDWVQTLLYAAHLDARPIAAVARWALSAADEDTQTEIVTILSDAEAAGDEGAGIAVQKLLGLIATPDKERGSIISTMVGLLRVYDSVSARRVGDNPNFDPRAFVESNDTLYITARPDKQNLYAPLLAALLEQIRFETYDRTKREQAGLEPALPHVTFALDEANTTAPIPLPAIISEAGGQGLHIVVGIQALGPAIARWGDAARSFLTLFPTKVIFRGVFDSDTISALSSASGEYDRQMTSYSVSTSYLGNYSLPIQQVTPSYTTQRQQVLTEGDITAIPHGHALVWDGPVWGLLRTGMHWNSEVWQAVSGQAPLSALPRGLKKDRPSGPGN